MKRRARSSTPTRRASPKRRTGPALLTRGTSKSPRPATGRRAAAPGRTSASGQTSARGRPAAAGRRITDASIRRDICERLARPAEDLDLSDLANEHVDVSDVRVSVAGGKVVLQGTVPERRMKPYIEALVDACPGVQDIDNRLRVRLR